MLSADVVVIGAGVTGLATAYFLNRLGCSRVLVVEREGIARGPSGINPGGVRRQWSTRINSLMSEQAVAFFDRINDELAPERPILFRKCGYLFVAVTDQGLKRMARQVELQRSWGAPVTQISPAEAKEILPGLNAEEVRGGTYCTEEGFIDDPAGVAVAFANAALRQGTRVHYVEATRILSEEGRVTGVHLADGTIVHTERVVVAAGGDTPRLAASVGVTLPIDLQPRYIFFSAPQAERFLEPALICPELEFGGKQLHDGALFLSCLSAGSDHAVGDSQQDWEMKIATSGTRLVPRLSHARIERMVTGDYDITPDYQPILGPVDGLEGFYLSCGFSGHGFMMAPVVGENLARLILDRPTTLPMSPFALGRFRTGSLSIESAVL